MTNITFSDEKAFIDLQPVQPTPGGTLHVSGIADTHNTNEAKLQKREPQGIIEKILLLEIIELDFVPAKNPQQIGYTKGLSSTEQYESIEIYFGEEKLATIDKIDVVN